MSRIIKPPSPILLPSGWPSVFLAGSIEMGQARDWQRSVEEAFEGFKVAILNPRRDEWDSTWKQSIDHPQFREQVEWELTGLELADVILMYLDPGTRAPVSLLELGLSVRGGRLVVCCPNGYWRKGNVEVVCARFNVPLVETLEELIETGLRTVRLRNEERGTRNEE